MIDTCDAEKNDLDLRCPGCNYKLRRIRRSRLKDCREMICPGCGHVFTEDDIDDSKNPDT
jgi:uncharacterized protein with PIN domain